MEYSKRLGDITDEQFQKALDRFHLGKLMKAEPISFGNFGQNVFITSTAGEFVFRGKPHYRWQFKNETYMVNLLHEKTTVPVPYPYLFEESNAIFGWSYVIMPRMKGKQFNHQTESQLPKADRIGIAQALGKNLAQLHALTWNYSGRYDEQSNTIKPFACSFSDWVVKSIEDLLEQCRGYNGRTTPEDIQWVQELISHGKEALQASFSPTCIMQDYQITNVTVDREEDTWKVIGVFDFMENYFGDSEIDLSRTFANYIDKESEEFSYVFLRAYFEKRNPRPGFEKRFPIYMLKDRLLIWEWSQRTKNMWWNPELTLQQWCKRFTLLDKDRLR